MPRCALNAAWSKLGHQPEASAARQHHSAGRAPSSHTGSAQRSVAPPPAARTIEDISTHFDWRPGAVRNILFLGDEPLEGGLSLALSSTGQDQEDIEAANRAIEVAKQTGTRVHTYMGTGKYSSDAAKHERIRKAIEAEYARVARETDGQFFASQDSLSAFEAMLEKVICGSKTDPRVTTTEFCCCQEYVEQREVTAAPQ
ncbi:hypothetical protein ACMHYB_06090 [Sorangium sp. So ce1128]